MQEITNCVICFDVYTPENPAVCEPVNLHSCHRECWEGWMQQQNRPVHRRWWEYIFGNWHRYDPVEAHYTSCPSCREWIRSDELMLEADVVRRDPGASPPCGLSVGYVLCVIPILVFWALYSLVRLLVNFFLPCVHCPHLIECLS